MYFLFDRKHEIILCFVFDTQNLCMFKINVLKSELSNHYTGSSVGVVQAELKTDEIMII